LLLGVAYCIEAVGTITTYTNYTNTAVVTVPPANFSSVNTAIPTAANPAGPTVTPTILPAAAGTISGCVVYRNYDNTNGNNACSDVAIVYGITFNQLLSWNPSLSSTASTCQLQSGFSYCVQQSAACEFRA
jgi:hypothetical protein